MTDDRTAIMATVDAIFDTVDAKDWDATRRLFTDEVDVDFTSLAGGVPARITVDQLVGGWIAGLHPRKQSWHLVGHYRVRVEGDTAVVHTKGYAWNRLDEELGGGMWEVWGTYELPFTRTPDGWKASGFVFNAQATRGDDAVRTHALG
ncbi:nuclear transport factor 2 family protein [Hamadaea tsunoensis]|uniref:nuclear transport factor 2 family protein n=1 Tax=Hamadaea tsunoensis TaxID=53368 RepID=UPI0004084426|nr:nuclear transport factor 2 family protein [Hamadaea tsunoensis]